MIQKVVALYCCFVLLTYSWAQTSVEVIQNALLEGVQLSVEDAESGDADEQLIRGYFIFRDKPTNYFYTINEQEKKIVFEFTDTELGSSPIVSSEAGPITGFQVEQTRVDVNQEIRGLRPEWHDVVKVTFNLVAIPNISVIDEYSVITFSFPWTSDPDKIDDYIQKKSKTKAVIISSLALFVGGAGGFAAWWFLREDPGVELKPLPIDDLPTRPSTGMSQ